MGDCELETCMQGLDPDTLRQGENRELYNGMCAENTRFPFYAALPARKVRHPKTPQCRKKTLTLPRIPVNNSLVSVVSLLSWFQYVFNNRREIEFI